MSTKYIKHFRASCKTTKFSGKLIITRKLRPISYKLGYLSNATYTCIHTHTHTYTQETIAADIHRIIRTEDPQYTHTNTHTHTVRRPRAACAAVSLRWMGSRGCNTSPGYPLHQLYSLSLSRCASTAVSFEVHQPADIQRHGDKERARKKQRYEDDDEDEVRHYLKT